MTPFMHLKPLQTEIKPIDRATLRTMRADDYKVAHDSFSDHLTAEAVFADKPAFWNLHVHSQASLKVWADLMNTDKPVDAFAQAEHFASRNGYSYRSVLAALIARLLPANEAGVVVLQAARDAVQQMETI